MDNIAATHSCVNDHSCLLADSVRPIVRALQGKWYGSYGVCRCPAHDDANPSLSITDRNGKLLVMCHAGCRQRDVIAGLRDRGLWPSGPSCRPTTERAISNLAHGPDDDERNLEIARRIWGEGAPITGTMGDRYFTNRAINPNTPLPATLRFHRRLWHRQTQRHYAGIIARINTAEGRQVGLHRIFLEYKPDDLHGTPEKIGAEPAKMALGPIAGGAIHLGETGGTLIVCEGIEDGLSIMTRAEALGVPCCVWAAVSASHLASVIVPKRVRRVFIFEDADAAGRRGADRLYRRLKAEGRDAVIVSPPDGSKDCNEALHALSKGAAW
jgi:Toprim domain-containing protein